MANVLGIVAEYNPFHNGHLYHLQKSKELTRSEYTVCVMSGNFVQRGQTALFDKWTRTEMCLKNGVDLVIELPTIYATSSSENFADGAIKILNSLGVVDFLSFGSENCDIDLLNQIATIFYEEPKPFSGLLSHELKKGVSFPKARENALLMYTNNIKKYSNILNKPNNILGIEYLKALKRHKSHIIPFCVKREKVYYDSEHIVDEYASATAIRGLLKRGRFDEIRTVMPDNSYMMLCEQVEKGDYVVNLAEFEKEILYKLRQSTVEELSNLPDVGEGLEYAIKNASNECNSLKELVGKVKSKRYTQSRIQRILIYVLLNITKKDMEISKKIMPYIRVLGMNSKGRKLLSAIDRVNPKIKLVTSPKKFLDSIGNNKNLKTMMEKDIEATNIYSLAYKRESSANQDFTKKIIVEE